MSFHVVQLYSLNYAHAFMYVTTSEQLCLTSFIVIFFIHLLRLFRTWDKQWNSIFSAVWSHFQSIIHRSGAFHYLKNRKRQRHEVKRKVHWYSTEIGWKLVWKVLLRILTSLDPWTNIVHFSTNNSTSFACQWLILR